jgi:hypothetical protein
MTQSHTVKSQLANELDQSLSKLHSCTNSPVIYAKHYGIITMF